MRRINRKVLTTILCIAVILVLTLSIAYAALSETLSISGTGTVNASSWDISLNNSTTNSNEVTGSATYTKPVISGTTVTYSVGLNKPSDSITLYFDVANYGDIVGEISSIITQTPTCTSETGNTADESLVCSNLDISLQYSDGTAVQVGDIVNTNGEICPIDANVYKSTTLSIMINVKLKDSMTTLPTSKVTITNISHDIIYSQAERKCVPTPRPSPLPAEN